VKEDKDEEERFVRRETITKYVQKKDRRGEAAACFERLKSARVTDMRLLEVQVAFVWAALNVPEYKDWFWAAYDRMDLNTDISMDATARKAISLARTRSQEAPAAK